MVKIRLTRTGRKNAPSYRVVATDSRSKRDGKFLEIIGFYNPTEGNDKFEVKKDRYEYWLSVGAQPSNTVKKLIKGTYKYVPYDPNAKPDEDEVEDTNTEENSIEEKPEGSDNTKPEAKETEPRKEESKETETETEKDSK